MPRHFLRDCVIEDDTSGWVFDAGIEMSAVTCDGKVLKRYEVQEISRLDERIQERGGIIYMGGPNTLFAARGGCAVRA